MVETTVSQQTQEAAVPEYNWIEKLDGLLYAAHLVTHRSNIAPDVTRPMSLRNKRAELYGLAYDGIHDKKAIIAEAHDRDAIAMQYLNQGDISVTLEGLGTQTSRYTIIEPPESRKKPGEKPVFIIPGISHDLDAVGAMVQEFAFAGKKVITAGFPESNMGKTTTEFAGAVEKSSGFEAHAAYYKEAINALLGEEAEVEIVGFSTGAPVTAEILKDEKFRSRVTRAILISPACMVDQSSREFLSGVMHEVKGLATRLRTLPSYGLIMGRSSRAPEQSNEQGPIKKRIFEALVQKVKRKLPDWEKMRVKEGGNITVVVGTKDELTKSYKGYDVFDGNPQVRFFELANGLHNTPITEASDIIPQILEMQK